MTDPRAAFAALALERARARADVQLALPSEDELCLELVPRAGGPLRLNLHALFVRCRDLSPEARLDAVDQHLEAAIAPLDAPRTWADALPLLRCVLRAPSALGHAPASLVARPVLPSVLLAAVIAHPRPLAMVTQAQADGWGLATDAVLGAALLATPEPRWEPWDEAAGLWCSDEGTAAASLLRPSVLRSAESLLGGPAVVAMPDRFLTILGPARPDSVARLARSAANEYAAAGGPLSPCLYTGAPNEPLHLHPGHPALEPLRLDPTPSALEPLRLAPGHPAFEALERARIQLWADEVHVAAGARSMELELSGVRGEDGRLRTAVGWIEGFALPEAELTIGGPAPAGEVVPGTWPPWRRP